MTTPTERLSSSAWRRSNSAWMLPVIGLCGLGTWAGFLYIGQKSKNSKWTRNAIMYGVAVLPSVVVLAIVGDGQEGNSSMAEKIASWPIIAVWVIGIAQAVRINKEWLTTKAHIDSDSPQWPPRPQMAGTPLPPPPLVSTDALLRGGPQAPTSTAVATNGSRAAIDLNTATLQQLQGDLGLDQETAIRVLQVRAQLGQFTSPEQLITQAGVQPHVFAAIRSRLLIGTVGTPAMKPGRRLDL